LEEVAKCKDFLARTAFKDRGQRFFELFPNREVVRDTPYLAILAASLFYSSGEPEAAAALLDQWARQFIGSKKPYNNLFRERLADLYYVRVLNLIGIFIADFENVVNLELAARYQWSAYLESERIIGADTDLSKFQSQLEFTKKEPWGLVAGAWDYWKKGQTCPDGPTIRADLAYILFRRYTQLNNAIYYLSLHPEIVEAAHSSGEFDKWMDALLRVKVHCLRARALPSVQKTEHLNSVVAAVDTLSWGFLAQAIFRKANEHKARIAICKSYRAAAVVEAISLNRQSRPFTDHSSFLSQSLLQNGTEVSALRSVQANANHVRSLRARVEALGEGACKEILGESSDIWSDYPDRDD
jgi:hypothetical protein